MSIKRNITILASSDKELGASNISSTNNRFTVNLDVPIEIPSNAYNITVSCKQLIMWNTVFNITNTNNQIFIGAPNTLDVRQDKLITVPLGLYSVFTLYARLLDLLKAENFKQTPDPVITFLPDEPTQKVNISLNYGNSVFSFFQLVCPHPMNEILGYDNLVYYTPTLPMLFTAPYVSKFNVNDYYLLRTSLTRNSFFVNKYQNQIIAQIPTDVEIGYQIFYNPANPDEIECDNLQGANLQNFEVELLNPRLQPLNIPENWSCQLKLSWTESAEFKHSRGF